jgi:hypothetical protein
MAKQPHQYVGPRRATQIHTTDREHSERAFRPQDDDYIVNLINMSNNTYQQGSTNYNRQTGAGNWFVIPTTAKNCNSDCDDCYNAGSFQPIFSVACNTGAFNLWVATLPDAKGNRIGAEFTITPNCDYAGGVICITN